MANYKRIKEMQLNKVLKGLMLA
ncbi:peptidoglycan-associated outer membrane lipoprotein, partial [Escherichia coli]